MTDSHLGYLHRAQRWYQHILPGSNSVLLTLNLLDIDSGSPGYCLHFMIGSPVNDCCTDGSICFSWTCWQCHRLCLESSEIQIRTSLQNFHHKCPAVMKCICNHDQRAPIVLKTELSRNSRSVIRQVVCISCELRKALDCCVITAFSTGPSENCSHFEPHNSEKKQKTHFFHNMLALHPNVLYEVCTLYVKTSDLPTLSWLQPNFSLQVSLSCHCQPHSSSLQCCRLEKAAAEFSQT